MQPILEKIRAQLNIKVLLILFFVVFILFSLAKVFAAQPLLQPQDLQVTNITHNQVSISWTTSAPVDETLVFWEGEKFMFIPNGVPFYEDDKKDIQPTGQMLTHHITLSELEANKSYKFRIYSGFLNVYEGQFTTAGEISAMPAHPIYGKVIDSSNNPVGAALVYFQIRTGVDYSTVMSTYTNLQGDWSLDLNQLRDANLQSRFEPNNLSDEVLLIKTGTDQRIVHSTVDFDEPWPTVVMP